MNVILETERLLLREFVPADVDELALVICDRENMRFYPALFERSDAEAWIQRNLRRYREQRIGLWAMILKSEARLVGDCGLVYQNVNGTTEVEVGYHLNRAYQGRGLATEAARACRDYAFQALGLTRVISLIRPENLPSRRVAERNGMKMEGEALCMGLPHLIYVATASKSGA